MNTSTDSNENQVFLDLFKGRQDYFAVQTTNIYCPVKRSFSDYYLERHLKKIVTFGIYVLTKESKCNFLCIDIDIPKSDLETVNFEDKSIKFEYLKPELLEIQGILTNKLEIDENSILLEDTGGRGYHIWLFLETPISGEDAIKFFKILNSYVSFSFEYFPKQPNLNQKRELGNLIKLPLGVHQKYNSESSFFTIDNNKIRLFRNLEENFEHLKNLNRIKPEIIKNIIKKEASLVGATIFPKITSTKGFESDRILYTADLDFLFKNCSALENLKSKAESGIALSYSEAFHLSNILLSVNSSECILIELIKKSYGPKFSFDRTEKEIERIRCLHPTSCKRLIYHNLCKGYCQPDVEKNNSDNLLPDTTPLSAWLFPIKKELKIEDYEIHEKISDLDNIRNAYFQLKKYHKEEDVLFFDEFDFESFEKNFEVNLSHISRILRNKEDFPFVEYLIVDVPKKVDEDQSMQYRPMAYSNIFTQVIIQSIFNIISIVLEHNFEDSSFGYRYNVENLQDEDIFYNWKEYYPKFKSKALEGLKDPSNTHYVCCDIKGYYDHIDHAILIQQLRQYIKEKYIITLLEKIVSIYEFGKGDKKGIPQGPAYARILANLYLNDFDKEIKKYTSGYYRYVDDFFLFFKSRDKAEDGLRKTNELLDNLGLVLSDDEKKRPEIKETIDDQKIIDTIDSLKYGIFEEFKFLDYLDIQQVIDFYNSVERDQVSPRNYAEILAINNLLPSILYLISKKYEYSVPLKGKILAIIQYLVENKAFYPKRLRKIFYQIIELMKEQNINIVQLFRDLHDTHKIYFLLSLYDIYQHHDKYREDLSRIVEENLHSNNPFLSGFSIAIANRLDIKNILLEKEYFENLLNIEGYFPKVKLYNAIDYFKLAPEIQEIFRYRITSTTPYIERKALISNIESYYSIYVDDLFLRGLFGSDFYMLLPECCSLFAKIQSQNILFDALQSNISNLVDYKDISIEFLATSISKVYSEAGISRVENLYELADTITDTEIKREIKNTIARIRNASAPSDGNFAKTHSFIKKYNECFLYKNDADQRVNYDYLEIIPKYKLNVYGFEDLDSFKKSLENLSIQAILPELDMEFDSTKDEILLKYKIPEFFEEIASYQFNLTTADEMLAFDLLTDAFKKALYFYEELRFIPFITSNNMYFNLKKRTVVFKNVGSIMCPVYTINARLIRNNDPHEIPLMLSILIKELFFHFSEKKIDEFYKSRKKGIELFLSHFMKRLSLQDPAMRYSFQRFHYLVQKLKEIDLSSEYDISIFYFRERLKAKLYEKSMEELKWENICKALLNFYQELAEIYDSVDFSDLKYLNKTFLNGKIPRKLHHLSKLLVNISLNIENLFPNIRKEKAGFDLIDLLNHFAVFCIESNCFFRNEISDTLVRNLSLELGKSVKLRANDYTIEFHEEDTKKLNVLLNQLKNSKNIFEPTISFDLKLASFIYFAFNFELKKNSGEISIEKTDRITEKNFDLLTFNLLVRIPNIENQTEKCVNKVLLALKTNQEFQLTEEENNLKNDIITFSFDLLKIMNSSNSKRYFGKNVKIKRWPPNVYCRSKSFRTYKTDKQAFGKIPLTNLFPATSSRCSWDMKNKNVTSLVIPNERINKLIFKLTKGKVFGYKFNYIYSEKAKLVWDIVLIVILSLLFSSYGALMKLICGAGIIFFLGKIIRDNKYWSININRVIEYIRK